ncbi:hypothetical protein [Streptococcus acidominimus]|uniref:Uncharacterized protein n=1 Tax=Streptococcus acidominimus TaxID=1326 RepID=A0A1Q8EC63_STRAI|nr:hypothetical protein [Streptococcus acidominimus]OLF49352.1 hypothetical protein BU200_07725 [Streptococcus acidominimus]SUN07270.1 Uncharacterised protein [Streptococcus acidominimus]
MSLTDISWEEFDTYNKVEVQVPIGFDFRVHNGKYYTFGEFGIASVRKIFEIAEEDYTAFLYGERTARDINFKAQNGHWPLTEEEKRQKDKEFIIDTPTALIADPTSISLFSKEELAILVPMAEQQWIDWKGKLPNDYVSPLKVK